ncbi:sorting and assembly machinery component 50 homolog [Aricia agestis]|uniref:sorting and assembly machinery component 50 homolog n=1 Tax=Aricia agestis TaxID=91739 RepID=UPI001C202CEB|nr:sorting and assembly machinery component 50 homolog [Aricia agestis]
MGTVYAKAPENNSGMYDFDESINFDEPIQKPAIKLNGIRARVDKVHVDGLGRTKDDIIKATVDDLFQATDFEDVIMRAHKVRRALDSMGCFKEIGVFIDVSNGPGATPEGLEVTFQVNELSRVVGGVNTTVSENEGNLVVGVKCPNVAGRGERVSAEYSMGHRSTSNFSLTATKPYPHQAYVPVLSASIYQQNHQYPWSGYKLLDRGVLLDVAFRTSPSTKHNIQWEGLVRDTSVLSKNTSFKVRESSGPQMKSVVRHIVGVDHRDEAIFPRRGAWVQFTSELAGLGGGVAHLKTELQAQANKEIAPDMVLQWTVAGGVLHDVYGTDISDRFYLGGPASLRGFAQRGAGPRADGLAVGGSVFWASGLHLYTPLPFRPGKGGLGELFRSHFFVNAGCLAHPEETGESHATALQDARVSCGLGVALRVGGVARFELNYCVPLRARTADDTAQGLQFGIAANFL